MGPSFDVKKLIAFDWWGFQSDSDTLSRYRCKYMTPKVQKSDQFCSCTASRPYEFRKFDTNYRFSSPIHDYVFFVFLWSTFPPNFKFWIAILKFRFLEELFFQLRNPYYSKDSSIKKKVHRKSEFSELRFRTPNFAERYFMGMLKILNDVSIHDIDISCRISKIHKVC